MSTFTLAIHGGAGTIRREDLKPEEETAYRAGLQAALNAGSSILKAGGTALEAVRAAVRTLEDDILFNAGRGSVFGKNGQHEMDAAIMEGTTLRAGAVAGVQGIRNPVELAHAVMLHSQHVLLTGRGAEEFAHLQGLETAPPEYFFSSYRHAQWQQLQGSDRTALDHDSTLKEKKFGTVGAVAMDMQGHLAAATSTGGMTNKQFGRVGDSPLIGAGTYANDRTCAISCTGHGEPFIRAVTAYDVSCLMEYRGLSLAEAMRVVVHEKLPKLEGEGGMIGVDARGQIALDFNSDGMYRGWCNSHGESAVAIYRNA